MQTTAGDLAAVRAAALKNAKSILVARQRAETDFLFSVLNSSADASVTCDGRGTVLAYNAAAERMFGTPAAEAVGRPLAALLADPFRGEYEGGFAADPSALVGVAREVVAVRRGGDPFPVDLGMSEFLLHDRRHFHGVIRDATERKALENQLRQAQKMEAVGQLAGGVAHDFNNQLSVICGCAELLLGTAAEGGPDRELLAAIVEAGHRAATLTRQLLAFSRKQILEPKVLNLNETVANVESMLRRLIGEDVHLAAVLHPTVRPVRADPAQLEQVLVNLVLNARDAMPGGGKLTICTRNAELDEAYCRDREGCTPGRYTLLSVTDSGGGMPPEVQARIFEPFFTTKEAGKGTGLGLAMVFGFVKQSGGHVAVYSEPGRGTSFKIYLPQFGGAAASAAAPHPAAPVPRGHETLLLVEDEKSVRRLTQLLLEGNGYEVLVAADGEDALRLVERHAGPIHLLLTDVVMPRLSGRVVAERIAALRPAVKVLFMSGYTDDAVVRHGIVHENMPFLQKPFTAGQLATKVRALLDDARVET